MKKIPETFELSEDDIQEAIAHWLNEEHCDGEYVYDFDISFSVDRVAVTPPKGAPVGGMGDYSVQKISAKAVKKG
jgi:hypothetical protein